MRRNTHHSGTPYFELAVVESNMLTVCRDIAVTRLVMLAKVLSAGPL